MRNWPGPSQWKKSGCCARSNSLRQNRPVPRTLPLSAAPRRTESIVPCHSLDTLSAPQTATTPPAVGRAGTTRAGDRDCGSRRPAAPPHRERRPSEAILERHVLSVVEPGDSRGRGKHALQGRRRGQSTSCRMAKAGRHSRKSTSRHAQHSSPISFRSFAMVVCSTESPIAH